MSHEQLISEDIESWQGYIDTNYDLLKSLIRRRQTDRQTDRQKGVVKNSKTLLRNT